MNLGVIFIALCILALVASFVMTLPGWINLLGIAFGVVGLLLIGRKRKGGGA